MRKVDDGEEKRKKRKEKKKEKIMTFIVATNVVASWPPERRPTGTPHARAKSNELPTNSNVFVVYVREKKIYETYMGKNVC